MAHNNVDNVLYGNELDGEEDEDDSEEKGELEDNDGHGAVLVDDEEEQRQHLVSYTVNLPVVATAVAGCHEH